MKSALVEEIETLEVEMQSNESELNNLLSVGALLLNEHEKVTVEIIAGAGGDSAGMSVEEMYQVYQKLSDHMGWEIESEEIESKDSGLGFDRIEMVISGENISSYMGKGFLQVLMFLTSHF